MVPPASVRGLTERAVTEPIQPEYDDEPLDENDAPPPRRSWRKDLQAKADRVPGLERENAFLKAGIDPDDPKARYFVKGYDGKLERDAVRAAAVEAGVIEASKVTREELAAHDRVSAAAAGAGSASTAPQTMNEFVRAAIAAKRG